MQPHIRKYEEVENILCAHEINNYKKSPLCVMHMSVGDEPSFNETIIVPDFR